MIYKIMLLLAVSCAMVGCSNDTNAPPPSSYPLTLNAITHGLLVADPAGPAYSPGTVVTLTATADPQYKVGAWSGTDDDTSKGLVNHVTMSAAKTVGVQFAPLTQQQFTLTLAAPGGNGSLAAQPPGPSYTDGTQVTLTAAPASGYKFLSWQGTDDDALTTSTNSVIMTSDRTVNARFTALTQQQFTLTLAVPGGNGTLAALPPGPSYVDGTQVSLTATADAGFQVLSWNGTANDGLTTATNTVFMTANKTVSATFGRPAADCPVDPVTGNAVSRMISPADGTTLPIGAITFEWCNAHADNFLEVEHLLGAHEYFFAFTGGVGTGAGLTSVTLVSPCPTSQTTVGCIPPQGQSIHVRLWTIRSKKALAPSPFDYSYTAPTAP